ncbi:MAG: T9SS type A sorting domain-containing protein, partial [Bacteroidia bacterium]
SLQNLLISGDFRDTIIINNISYISQSQNDGFLLSLDQTGSTNWFKEISGPGDDDAKAIHVDKNGNLFLTGKFTNNAAIEGQQLNTNGIYSTYIVKFNPSGSMTSVFKADTDSGMYNGGYKLQTDNDGNIYILGDYDKVTFGSSSVTDINGYSAQYFAKLDSLGQLMYLQGITSGVEAFCNFKVSPGAIFFTGGGSWTSGSWTKTEKYSLSGSKLWSKSHAGFYYEYCSSNLTLNDTGFYTIGMQGNPNIPTWITTYDLMISKFTSSGQENCSYIHSAGSVNGVDIMKSGDDEYLVLGYTPDTISFDNITITKNTGNLFIAKFHEKTTVTSIADKPIQSEQFMVVPNPSSGQFDVRLKGPVKEGKVSIYDVTGNRIIEKTISNTSLISFDLQNEIKGIYLLNIETGKEKTSKKIIFN